MPDNHLSTDLKTSVDSNVQLVSLSPKLPWETVKVQFELVFKNKFEFCMDYTVLKNWIESN